MLFLRLFGFGSIDKIGGSIGAGGKAMHTLHINESIYMENMATAVVWCSTQPTSISTDWLELQGKRKKIPRDLCAMLIFLMYLRYIEYSYCVCTYTRQSGLRDAFTSKCCTCKAPAKSMLKSTANLTGVKTTFRYESNSPDLSGKKLGFFASTCSCSSKPESKLSRLALMC